jgi:CDP-diacylglycerol--glycerol-3-phosphate 3-phosphatidyltransferase
LSIANYLTLIRIVISPLFLSFYLYPSFFNINSTNLPYILLFLFSICEASDAFDGYLARKYDQVTDLGKILDPMADSIYRLSVFLAFTQAPVNLPTILIFIFFYRDSLISTLRTICALKGFALAARPSGKIKAAIQALAAFIIILLMIPHSLGYLSTNGLHTTSTFITAIAAVYSLCSGVDYIYANRHYIMKLLIFRKKEE